MHHGSYERQELSGQLREMLDKARGKSEEPTVADLGATGQFPDGKVCPEDQGEIQFAIGSDPEKQLVLLDFGKKPVGFVAMTAQQAVDVAQSLIKHARAIATEPISIVLH